MFVYYDSQGVLKEVINVRATRQGDSSGVDYVYFFVEGADPQVDSNGVYQAISLSGLRVTFYNEEGEIIYAQDISVGLQIEEWEIPYDKKRELTHFKYFTKYEMFAIPVPDEVLNDSGSVGLRIRVITPDTTIMTLGFLVFNVERTGTHPIITDDTAITIAQWNYLIANMLTIEDLENPEAMAKFADAVKLVTDSALSSSSEMPVQNKVVTAALNNKVDKLTVGQDSIYATKYITGQVIQIGIQYGYDAYANFIVQRTSGGQINVPLTPTETYHATSKSYVDNNIQDIREVAEGKCKSIIISYNATIPTEQTFVANTYKKGSDGTYFQTFAELEQYVGGSASFIENILFNSQNASISTDQSSVLTVDKYIYRLSEFDSDLKIGDIILVTETDVPDRWFSGLGNCYKLETSKVDLTNYFAKSESAIPTNNGTQDLGSSSYAWKDLYLSGKLYLRSNQYLESNSSGSVTLSSDTNNTFYFGTRIFRAVSNNLYDLGSSSVKWKDLYLAGNIKGASTLTQAQYDALVSGGTVDADTFYFIEEE